ncbi:MAG: hypothetical protein AB7J97_13065 [Steroidobacteraceae bacterium]
MSMVALLLVSLAWCPTDAKEARVSLIVGKNRSVCQFVLHETQQSLNDQFLPLNFAFLPNLAWRRVSYTFVHDRGERHILNAESVEFDIDNDGRAETLLRESIMFHSTTGEFLFVFPQGKAPSAPTDTVTRADRAAWRGINSFGSWPYLSRNLALLEIRPFSYAGRNYLLLTDSEFARGRRGAMVVAQYRGVPLPNAGTEGSTDNFKTICQIQ